MPCINTTISSVLAALLLTCVAPGAASATDTVGGPGPTDHPADIADSDVLSAHANLPDPEGRTR